MPAYEDPRSPNIKKISPAKIKASAGREKGKSYRDYSVDELADIREKFGDERFSLGAKKDAAGRDAAIQSDKDLRRYVGKFETGKPDARAKLSPDMRERVEHIDATDKAMAILRRDSGLRTRDLAQKKKTALQEAAKRKAMASDKKAMATPKSKVKKQELKSFGKAFKK